jgi:hypothetical protein
MGAIGKWCRQAVRANHVQKVGRATVLRSRWVGVKVGHCGSGALSGGHGDGK